MYQKSGSYWTELLSCPAFVGKNGLGKTKEGDQKTPEGIFDLPVAFGIMDNPGSKIPYVKVNENLYWCGDDSIMPHDRLPSAPLPHGALVLPPCSAPLHKGTGYENGIPSAD